MSEEIVIDNNVILYSICSFLIIILLIIVAVSYKNGFNTGLNAFCGKEKVYYDNTNNKYFCSLEKPKNAFNNDFNINMDIRGLQ